MSLQKNPVGARERTTKEARTPASFWRRAAHAQPRALLGATALLLGASVWYGYAAAERGATPLTDSSARTKSASVGSGSTGHAAIKGKKPLSLNDLPGLMAQYATHTAEQKAARASATRTVVGSKTNFSLTEVDLTGGNKSDERNPVYSPDGNFIAFESTGVDANRDGRLDANVVNADGTNGTPRYHLWIMNRDGSGQRQLTGLAGTEFGGSARFDQREPAFSPDGNSLFYVNKSRSTTGVPTDNIFEAQNVLSGSVPGILQITDFPVDLSNPSREVRSPVVSPDSSNVAFSANFNLYNGRAFPRNPTTGAPEFDIFTQGVSNRQFGILTGPAFNRFDVQSDDLNPVFVPGSQGLLAYSSQQNSPDGTTQNAAILSTGGRRIWVLNVSNPAQRQQLTFSTQRGKRVPKDSDDFPSFSRLSNVNLSGRNSPLYLLFQTDSLIDAQDTTGDLNVWSLPLTSLISIGTTNTTELKVAATLESNRLSSPNVAPSGTPIFPNAFEDKVADREPGGAALNATTSTQATTNTIFASQRAYAGAPGPSTNPGALPLLNPDGGRADSTHDIWRSQIQDITPPLLVPATIGGKSFVFLAPGPQAALIGLNAPRTPNEGLNVGGRVNVGVVLQDKESGFADFTRSSYIRLFVKPVSLTRYDINKKPDDKGNPVDLTPNGFSVQVANEREVSPSDYNLINGNFPNSPPLAAAIYLSPYDDGPIAQGGHERQANAVRGDGTFYCEGAFTAPARADDFYFDLDVQDAAGNRFLYDNIYGCSTLPLTGDNGGDASVSRMLFVSDYTVGQTFPQRLTGFAPGSSVPFKPVESQALNNPGGAIGKQTDTVVRPPFDGFAPYYGLASRESNPSGRATQFSDYDSTQRRVYRILCRGPVPQSLLNSYQPGAVSILNPALFPSSSTTTFNLDPSRKPSLTPTPVVAGQPTPQPIFIPVVSSQSYIIWDSPYTGDVVTGGGSGTLSDATTQDSLTNFLNLGGRLWLFGNDIARTLGNTGSSFLTNELRASFAGEVSSTTAAYTVATGSGGVGTANATDTLIATRSRDGFAPSTLHLAYAGGTNDFGDAAIRSSGSFIFNQTGIFLDDRLDVLNSLGAADANQTVRQSYFYGGAGGKLAAQRIERRGRSSTNPSATNRESRVVFFGFGQENINREYGKVGDVEVCFNNRAKVADNVRNYFLTGGISGTVTQLSENGSISPAPNFVVVITATGVDSNAITTPRFFAVTDANGRYSIQGLPAGSYTVSPAEFTDSTGVRRSYNGPFFPADSVGVLVSNGTTFDGINLTVRRLIPGGIAGTAVSDNKTPTILTDDRPQAAQVPVLLVAATQTNASVYSDLTVTAIDGTFSFTGVPPGFDYILIFNPRYGNRSQGGDVPDNSTVQYQAGGAIQQNPNYGRRIIPVDPTYPVNFTRGLNPAKTAISVPDSNTVQLGLVPLPLGGRIPPPSATPTPTPIPDPLQTPAPGTGSGGPTNFTPNVTYQISVPYADNSVPTATTTVDKAFSLPKSSGTANNFIISRYDALNNVYVALNGSDTIRRGEGYFIRSSVPVSLRLPSNDASRIPTNVSSFDIFLFRNSANTTTSSGSNLIGFPFNPLIYSRVDWLDCSVRANGVFYQSVRQAAAAGVINDILLTYNPATGQYEQTRTMVPFRGYYAQVYTNNVTVTLNAKQG